jgi:hypothetical protein
LVIENGKSKKEMLMMKTFPDNDTMDNFIEIEEEMEPTHRTGKVVPLSYSL